MNIKIIKIKQWFEEKQKDIILFIGVVLVCLLSFAMGFIFCHEQQKEPLIFEMIEDQDTEQESRPVNNNQNQQ